MSYVIFYNNNYIKKKKKYFSKKNKQVYIQTVYCKLKKKYNEEDFIFLELLLGALTKHGKKNKAYRILFDALFLLKKKNSNSFLSLYKSLNKIRPNILLFNKKRGTSVFELPRLLSLSQEKRSAVKWLRKSLNQAKKKSSQALAEEINQILLNQGDLLKKKERIINTSIENRPFFYLLKR